MLKQYFKREVAKMATIATIRTMENGMETEDLVPADDCNVRITCKLQNSDVLFCGFVSRYPRKDLLCIS